MKWWYAPIAPLLPSAAYLGLLEALYCWYEAGLVDSGTGLWLGGMLVALLSVPGEAVGGYEHTQYWVHRLGYSNESLSNFDRRYVEFHVPIFTTAALIYVAFTLAFIVVTLLAGRANRSGRDANPSIEGTQQQRA